MSNNRYCDENGYSDNYIYYNNESFYENYFSSAYEVAKIVAKADEHYNFYDDYVIFDVFGDLETSDDPADWVDVNELAYWIEENGYDISDLV